MHNMSGGSSRRVVSRTSSSNSHFPNIAVTGLNQRSVMIRTQQTLRVCLVGFGSGGGMVQTRWGM
jgi:hypothetical protein